MDERYTKKNNQVLLNGVQRLANVLITGAMPSIPVTALDVITGIIPITLWLDEEAETEKSGSLAVPTSWKPFFEVIQPHKRK